LCAHGFHVWTMRSFTIMLASLERSRNPVIYYFNGILQNEYARNITKDDFGDVLVTVNRYIQDNSGDFIIQYIQGPPASIFTIPS
jgi:hypothetical protein